MSDGGISFPIRIEPFVVGDNLDAFVGQVTAAMEQISAAADSAIGSGGVAALAAPEAASAVGGVAAVTAESTANLQAAAAAGTLDPAEAARGIAAINEAMLVNLRSVAGLISASAGSVDVTPLLASIDSLIGTAAAQIRASQAAVSAGAEAVSVGAENRPAQIAAALEEPASIAAGPVVAGQGVAVGAVEATNVAQAEVTSSLVAEASAIKLRGLARAAQETGTVDAFKTIHNAALGYDEAGSVADALPGTKYNDTVTQRQIALASGQIKAASQQALEAAQFPEQFTAYRQGDLAGGVVSLSTQPHPQTFPDQQPYTVNRSDVLTYGNAVQRGTFNEDEIQVEGSKLVAAMGQQASVAEAGVGAAEATNAAQAKVAATLVEEAATTRAVAAPPASPPPPVVPPVAAAASEPPPEPIPSAEAAAGAETKVVLAQEELAAVLAKEARIHEVGDAAWLAAADRGLTERQAETSRRDAEKGERAKLDAQERGVNRNDNFAENRANKVDEAAAQYGPGPATDRLQQRASQDTAKLTYVDSATGQSYLQAQTEAATALKTRVAAEQQELTASKEYAESEAKAAAQQNSLNAALAQEQAAPRPTGEISDYIASIIDLTAQQNFQKAALAQAEAADGEYLLSTLELATARNVLKEAEQGALIKDAAYQASTLALAVTRNNLSAAEDDALSTSTTYLASSKLAAISKNNLAAAEDAELVKGTAYTDSTTLAATAKTNLAAAETASLAGDDLYGEAVVRAAIAKNALAAADAKSLSGIDSYVTGTANLATARNTLAAKETGALADSDLYIKSTAALALTRAILEAREAEELLGTQGYAEATLRVAVARQQEEAAIGAAKSGSEDYARAMVATATAAQTLALRMGQIQAEQDTQFGGFGSANSIVADRGVQDARNTAAQAGYRSTAIQNTPFNSDSGLGGQAEFVRLQADANRTKAEETAATRAATAERLAGDDAYQKNVADAANSEAELAARIKAKTLGLNVGSDETTTEIEINNALRERLLSEQEKLASSQETLLNANGEIELLAARKASDQAVNALIKERVLIEQENINAARSSAGQKPIDFGASEGGPGGAGGLLGGLLGGGGAGGAASLIGGLAVIQGGFKVFSALTDAVKEATALDQVLAQVQAQATAIGQGADFGNLRDSILQISSDTGLAGSQVAGLAQEFLGLYQNANVAAAATSDAAKLINVIGDSAATAGPQIAAIAEDLNVSTKAIGNAVLDIQDQTGRTGKDALAALGQLSPVANELNLTLDQTRGLIIAVGEGSSKSGQQIGEGLARILPQLTKDLPKLSLDGIKFDAAAGGGDATAQLNNLITQYQTLNNVQKAGVISDLGGPRNAQILAAALNDPQKALLALNSTVQDNELLNERNAAVQDTLRGALDRLKTTAVALGDAFLHSGFTQGLKDFVEVGGVVIGFVGTIVGAFASLNSALGGVPAKMGEILLALTLLSKVNAFEFLVSGVRLLLGIIPALATEFRAIGAGESLDIAVAGTQALTTKLTGLTLVRGADAAATAAQTTEMTTETAEAILQANATGILTLSKRDLAIIQGVAAGLSGTEAAAMTPVTAQALLQANTDGLLSLTKKDLALAKNLVAGSSVAELDATTPLVAAKLLEIAASQGIALSDAEEAVLNGIVTGTIVGETAAVTALDAALALSGGVLSLGLIPVIAAAAFAWHEYDDEVNKAKQAQASYFSADQRLPLLPPSTVGGSGAAGPGPVLDASGNVKPASLYEEKAAADARAAAFGAITLGNELHSPSASDVSPGGRGIPRLYGELPIHGGLAADYLDPLSFVEGLPGRLHGESPPQTPQQLAVNRAINLNIASQPGYGDIYGDLTSKDAGGTPDQLKKLAADQQDLGDSKKFAEYTQILGDIAATPAGKAALAAGNMIRARDAALKAIGTDTADTINTVADAVTAFKSNDIDYTTAIADMDAVIAANKPSAFFKEEAKALKDKADFISNQAYSRIQDQITFATDVLGYTPAQTQSQIEAVLNGPTGKSLNSADYAKVADQAAKQDKSTTDYAIAHAGSIDSLNSITGTTTSLLTADTLNAFDISQGPPGTVGRYADIAAQEAAAQPRIDATRLALGRSGERQGNAADVAAGRADYTQQDIETAAGVNATVTTPLTPDQQSNKDAQAATLFKAKADNKNALAISEGQSAAQLAKIKSDADADFVKYMQGVVALNPSDSNKTTLQNAVNTQLIDAKATADAIASAADTLQQAKDGYETALATASNNPGLAGSDQLKALNDHLNYLRSLPGDHQADIINTQTQIVSQNAANATQARNQADALQQAQYAQLEAQDAAGGNPIQASRDQLNALNAHLRVLQNSPGDNSVDIANTRAAITQKQTDIANQSRDAADKLQQSQFTLAAATDTAAGDPVKAAQDQLAALQAHLRVLRSTPGDQSAAINDTQAQIVTATANIADTQISTAEKKISTDVTLHRISLGGAIGQLQALRKQIAAGVHTQAQLDEIDTQIQADEQAASGQLQFNIGNIKLPTLYEAKRLQAVNGSSYDQGASAGNTIVDSRVQTINITIHDAQDNLGALKMLTDAVGSPSRVGASLPSLY